MASDPSGAGGRAFTEDQFARVVRPVIGRMVHVAWTILHDRNLAWDATQEALMTLWLAPLAPPDARAWLIRAVVHRSLHMARSRRRGRRHEALASLDRPEARSLDDPGRSAEGRELHERLVEALDGLGEPHRAALTMLLLDGMDYQSIARTLGVPLGTVRSRINRSREAIRKVLGPTFGEGESPGRDQEGDEHA